MRTQRPRNVTCVPLSTPARERDHQLARLALGGDSRAWDLLYEKAIRSVPAAVRRADFQHFFSDWEYRDITDEALARCYDHLERYRGLSQPPGALPGAQSVPVVGAGLRQKHPAQPHSAAAHPPEEPVPAGARGGTARPLPGPALAPAPAGTGSVPVGGLLSAAAPGSGPRLPAGLFSDRLFHLGKMRSADQKSGPPTLSGRPQRHPLEFSPPLPDQPRSARVFLFRPRASPVRNSSRSSDSMWLRICALCSRTCMG